MDTRLWLKNYPTRSTLDYPKISLYHYLKKVADQYPNRTALIFIADRVTYREMMENIDRMAAAFTAMGLQKGDRIALMLPNCFAYVYCYFAAMRQGLVVAQLNPLLTARELSFIVRDSNARVLIAADAVFQTIEQAMLDQDIENLIVVPLTGEKINVNARPFDDILQQHEPNPPDVEINPEEDLAVLQYTGGTTGFPKGAMLTHYNLVANAEMTAEILREWLKKFGGKEVYSMGLLPFFHSYGMTVCLNVGLTIPAGLLLVPQFNADLIFYLIQQYKPVIFPGVPTAFMALMNHPEVQNYDLDSIDVCISGAAPMPVEAIEQFEQITGSSILEGYGLSETSPITHSNPFLGVRKPGSIGIPYPDTDCKIVDPDDGERELPIGEEGELIIKGPQIMKGYWNRPNDTASTLKNGWLYTGDIARMDEDGYFYIVDRKKDMIIYGGNKIYPREVEEVLYEHPKVAEAVCIGIPEKFFGEVVKAFIVLKDGAEATPEEIIEFCRPRMIKYKVPRQVEFRSELPKTNVGKFLRKDLAIEEQRRRRLELLEE
ncbi:MAG TPA: long-chain fatty acid--CoA ligase [Bacillota bacterium]|jgi:long-chain acyl-CoA synthetase|nr:long-chain fatty acid--CoA ligase [Bacillota bacterium]HOB28724.1 long-chain fatty acid--CoA ligase [Bacillota bacterium]HPZ41412.1 long-chain fatty acid--CoA ligase [Bacillota bacterium]HQD51679.1 long-chain fatty acid--CoA ligase [Bacillota bacterium]